MTDIDSDQTKLLLDRVEAGDRSALSRLLEQHRSELRRVLDLRMSTRLRQRVDASDIIQEAEIEVLERLGEFIARRPMPFRFWLRRTALQRLTKVRARHILASKRTVECELSLSVSASKGLCGSLIQGDESPGRYAIRREMMEIVKQVLSEFPEADREILLMRHLEKMTNVEIGYVLDLTPSAVSKRHVRSLVRLRSMLHRRGIEMSGP